MNVLIRRMELRDIMQVVAIDVDSFSMPWPPRSYQFELTDNPASRSWVAEIEGQVVGMLVAWMIVDEIHIATLATHKDFRRQGIAAKLLVHALQAAKAEGALTSFLEVREGNQAARQMYNKFHYVEVGRRKGYYKDNGEDAILMSLDRIDM
jgi:ribosomal-protein-alanine N-acetyltransferase